MDDIPLIRQAAPGTLSAARSGRAGSGPDCQVLVVGAGPTGLVLAADLLARGIRTRIIDKGDGVALQSRAIGIHARTLEVLDMMGLAERFTERGQLVRHFRFYSRGRRLVSLDLARCGSRFGFLLDLPQDQTERLLRAGYRAGRHDRARDRAHPAGHRCQRRHRDHPSPVRPG